MNKLKKDIEQLKKQQEDSDDEDSDDEDSDDEDYDDESSDDEEKEEKKEEEEDEKKPIKKYNEKYLNQQKVQQLKDICKSCGIGGYSGKNKALLIKFMLEHKKIQWYLLLIWDVYNKCYTCL